MNKRIYNVRKAMQLTQDEFADAIGVSKNYVWQLEKGERNPSKKTLLLICKTFHVSKDWLFDGTGEMFVPYDTNDRLLEWASTISEEDKTSRRRIVEALMTLTEEQWDVLVEVAKKIADGDSF